MDRSWNWKLLIVLVFRAWFCHLPSSWDALNSWALLPRHFVPKSVSKELWAFAGLIVIWYYTTRVSVPFLSVLPHLCKKLLGLQWKEQELMLRGRIQRYFHVWKVHIWKNVVKQWFQPWPAEVEIAWSQQPKVVKNLGTKVFDFAFSRELFGIRHVTNWPLHADIDT